MAHTFDKMVDGMLQTQMVEDTARIARESVDKRTSVVVAINNRAGGNAPMIARIVADRFLVVE